MEGQQPDHKTDSPEPTTLDVVSEDTAQFKDNISRLTRKAKKRSAKTYLKDVSSEKQTAAKLKKSRSSPSAQVGTAPTYYPDERDELPQSYGMTYLYLLPRDPHTIYAYWEINELDVHNARQTSSINMQDATYTLRLYDVSLIDFNGGNANSQIDFDELYMNSRYIKVPHDNAFYCAEIGIRQKDGRFIPLCRSNTVHTQTAGESGNFHFELKETRIGSPEPSEKLVNGHKEKIRQWRRLKNNLQFSLCRQTVTLDDIRLFYERGLNLYDIHKNYPYAGARGRSKTEAEKMGLDELFAIDPQSIFYKYKKHYWGSSENTTQEFLGASEGLFFREIKDASGSKKVSLSVETPQAKTRKSGKHDG